MSVAKFLRNFAAPSWLNSKDHFFENSDDWTCGWADDDDDLLSRAEPDDDKCQSDVKSVAESINSSNTKTYNNTEYRDSSPKQTERDITAVAEVRKASKELTVLHNSQQDSPSAVSSETTINQQVDSKDPAVAASGFWRSVQLFSKLPYSSQILAHLLQTNASASLLFTDKHVSNHFGSRSCSSGGNNGQADSVRTKNSTELQEDNSWKANKRLDTMYKSKSIRQLKRSSEDLNGFTATTTSNPRRSQNVVSDSKRDSISTKRPNDSSERLKGHAATTRSFPQRCFMGLIRKVDDKFECIQCGVSCKRKSSVKRHVAVHHMEKRLSCRFCDKLFSFPHELSKHLLLHTEEKPHTCQTCGKTFRLFQTLTKHQAVHSDDRRYSCQECGKAFKNSNGFLRHKRIHEKRFDASLQCRVCKRVFSGRQALQNHVLTHSEERTFKCEFCDKSYFTKIGLRAHSLVHTTGRVRKTKLCAVCGKQIFENMESLHMRSHSGEKPFVCEICGKGFPRRPNLIGHMRTHTGEKPYCCKTCGKSFALYSNMVTHCRKCESNTKSEKRAESTPLCESN